MDRSRLGIDSVAELINRIRTDGHEPAVHIDMSIQPLASDIKKMLRKEFTSSTYQIKEIEQYLIDADQCTTMVCGNLTLHCVYKGDAPLVPTIHMKHVIRRAQGLMTVCKSVQPMTFWLVPCSMLKDFPVPGKPVTVANVNSAYTYATGDTVFIYRREEWAKVLLHETIHHICSIETSKYWTKEHLSRIFTIFNIHPSTTMRPNEAIVETWAELFHLAFVSSHYNMSFQHMLQIELQWALVQAKRILRKQGNRPWKEGTHAFSYYVIRSLFLFKADAFLAASDAGDLHGLIDLAKQVFVSDDYGKALHQARIPKHKSFRMTVFGDL